VAIYTDAVASWHIYTSATILPATIKLRGHVAGFEKFDKLVE
jgi:hypothetical protein